MLDDILIYFDVVFFCFFFASLYQTFFQTVAKTTDELEWLEEFTFQIYI